PLEQRGTGRRRVRDFRTPRIAKGDRLHASELANIRAFGSETELMQVQAEVADRLNGPAGLMREIELTWEHMLLGAVQGVVYDANNTDVIYNWHTEFGTTQAPEVNFSLPTAADGDVRKKCNEVVRAMMKASKGAW